MGANMRMIFLKHSQWFRDMLRGKSIDIGDFPYNAWWYQRHIHTFYWSVENSGVGDIYYYLHKGGWKC